MHPKTLASRQSGFTLVELSIVLVIIGLIIGGVLVGQDMIKSAEVRATLGQVEKYNSSVNTFRSKYNNQAPGDVNAITVTNFGFTARSGAAGHGDGNGLLEGCSAAATVAGCETVLFWSDLAFANLIEGGPFTTATDALTAVAAGAQTTVFPPARLARGNYFTVFSASGLNYYQLAGITSTDATGVYTLTNALTPAEAFNMDSKIDDGAPASGVVRAMRSAAALNTAAADGDGCQTSATAYTTTTAAAAATPNCQVRFRFN